MIEMTASEVEQVDGAVLPAAILIAASFAKGFGAGVGIASAGYIAYQFYQMAR